MAPFRILVIRVPPEKVTLIQKTTQIVINMVATLGTITTVRGSRRVRKGLSERFSGEVAHGQSPKNPAS